MRLFVPAAVLMLVSMVVRNPSCDAQQNASVAGAGCTLERQDHFVCNRDGFNSALAQAHIVRLQTEHMDRFAEEQLRRLVRALGKQVANAEQHPDLVFNLYPVDRSGRIDFGPNDMPLGSLSVTDPKRGDGRRGLIWVETLDGQEDRPWPGTVVDLVRALKNDAQAH